MTETTDATSAVEGTAAHYFEFLDWATTKGQLPKPMVSNWAVAARNVLEIEETYEQLDLLGLDLDEFFERFRTLKRTHYSDGSMTAYRSRFRTGITAYRAWVAKEPDWKPATSRSPQREGKIRAREAAKNGVVAPAKNSKSKTGAQNRDEAGNSEQPPPPPPAGMIEYPYPIRPGLQARLVLPEDLTVSEARRITAFVSSLAWPAEDALLALLPGSE